MSNLEKINILTKETLDSLDLTQYKNQMFGTTDENESGGSSVVVDSKLNGYSTNPVQNKVLYGPVTFAESEWDRSKNILKYPYGSEEKWQRGITFTKNTDGSYTINGKSNGSGNSAAFLYYSNKTLQLPAGTYTVSISSNEYDSNINLVVYDGSGYRDVYLGQPITLQFDKTTTIRELYVQVRNNSPTTYNNFTVYPMIVEGTVAGNWHEWEGKVIHEKDLEGFGSSIDFPTATESAAGIIQIATNQEAENGTNTTKAVTPKQLQSALNNVETRLNTSISGKASQSSLDNLTSQFNNLPTFSLDGTTLTITI